MARDDSSTTIKRLLDRHAAGDPAARNDLIAHSLQRLRRLTHQMLRRFPRAREQEGTSDVLQEALIKLNRALSAVEITTVRDFLRLAATQIRRRLLDLARRPPRPEKPGGPDIAQAIANRPADIDDDPFELAKWSDFHRRIAEMDEQDRELFELIYYQGLSQPAAAKLIGMPLTTFKRRWQADRLRLAVQLRDWLS